MTLFPIAAGRLTKNLGYGMPLSSILSSVAFNVSLFFYAYIIGSFFRITVYPLVHRVTFASVFQEHIINEYLDYIIVILATTSWLFLSTNDRTIRYFISLAYGGTGIVLAVFSPENIILDITALLSLPLMVGIVLYCHKRPRNALSFKIKLTLQYISLTIIVISILAIVILLSSAFLARSFDPYIGERLVNDLFLLLSSFSTVYISLLVFCIPIKVIFMEALRSLKLNIKQDAIQTTISDNYTNKKIQTRSKIGFLLLAMILSIFLVLIPQHPSINNDNQNIGVDTFYYAAWVGELVRSESLSEFAYQAFVVQAQGERPLSLIILFLVYQITDGNLSEVVEYFPVILGPGIVLAFYFLTWELTRNERIALLAAFLGAVSFHTLAGIYAGFYANWLALVVGYVAIVFLFRYLRSGRISDMVVFSTLLVGVLFSHVYTWTVLVAVAGIFLLTMLVLTKKKKDDNSNNYFTHRRIIWVLLFAIVPSIVVDVTRVVLTGSSGGLEQEIGLAERGFGVEQLNSRWQTLSTTMHHSFGGVFSNFIILSLGLFWVIKSNMREPATIFLMIFLSTGLVPLLFGNLTIQSRVLYDIPFEIPAAISLHYISRITRSMLVPLAGCTWLVAVSLITVMNFYLIPITGIS